MMNVTAPALQSASVAVTKNQNQKALRGGGCSHTGLYYSVDSFFCDPVESQWHYYSCCLVAESSITRSVVKNYSDKFSTL